MPLTTTGVPSSLNSGREPRLSVLNRQATSRSLKLAGVICASGEYRDPRVSPVYDGQSPFAVDATKPRAAVPRCAAACGSNMAAAATSRATTNARRNAVRIVVLHAGPEDPAYIDSLVD